VFGCRSFGDLLDINTHEQLLVCRCHRCGASFAVAIVSAAFEGKRLLERHRIVNTALTEEMKDIHALSISKALTPKQWSDQQPAVVQKASEPEVQEQPAAAVV
jgi:stress-induced morphogen